MAGEADRAIGIDVGGTHVRVSLVDCTGNVHHHHTERVMSDRTGFTAQILRLVDRVQSDATVGVGIGIPGRVDADRGAILSAGYLDIADLDLEHIVGECFNIPVRLENDATMALIAEAAVRPDCRGVIAMVTVGTGIGGAILCGGTPFYGGGSSGQFGHLVVAPDGPLCNCGRRGCVETLSSGTALQRLIEEAGLCAETRVEGLLKAAAEGEPVSCTILETWSRPFQRALQSIVAAIDPELIVVGGGLGAAMVEALSRLPDESEWFARPVEAARLGDDAGAIGAGLRAFQTVGP